VVRLLQPPARRTDLIQAQPAGYDSEPSARVGDVGDISCHQPCERLLHGVLGLTDIAEHPECQTDQIRAMLCPRVPDLIRGRGNKYEDARAFHSVTHREASESASSARRNSHAAHSDVKDST